MLLAVLRNINRLHPQARSHRDRAEAQTDQPRSYSRIGAAWQRHRRRRDALREPFAGLPIEAETYS
jgi:hypothetical protein